MADPILAHRPIVKKVAGYIRCADSYSAIKRKPCMSLKEKQLLSSRNVPHALVARYSSVMGPLLSSIGLDTSRMALRTKIKSGRKFRGRSRICWQIRNLETTVDQPH